MLAALMHKWPPVLLLPPEGALLMSLRPLSPSVVATGPLQVNCPQGHSACLRSVGSSTPSHGGEGVWGAPELPSAAASCRGAGPAAWGRAPGGLASPAQSTLRLRAGGAPRHDGTSLSPPELSSGTPRAQHGRSWSKQPFPEPS